MNSKLKILAVIYAIAIVCVSNQSFAAEVFPCTLLKDSVLSGHFSDLETQRVVAFRGCIQKKSICMLTNAGIQGGDTAIDFKATGQASWLAIVQVRNSVSGACLIGRYSGGSAAAWLFEGWQVESGKAKYLEQFATTKLNSDAVPPDALLAIMLKAYKRARH